MPSVRADQCGEGHQDLKELNKLNTVLENLNNSVEVEHRVRWVIHSGE